MTKIEWTRGDDGTPGRTWNPTIGCSHVSPGCDHCYAAGVAHRAMQPAHHGLTIRTDRGVDWTGEVRCLPDRLEVPLRRRKPTRWFVDSMSDLFHPAVPDEFIAQVFATMAIAHHHTFLVLTKRPQRMATWTTDPTNRCRVDAAIANRLGARSADAADHGPILTMADARRVGRAVGDVREAAGLGRYDTPWPMPNVWLGASIETDRYTWRTRHLLGSTAAIRFLSLEPLLGPLPSLDLDGVDWVIIGGESGPGARPMDLAWAEAIVERCQTAGVAVFVKQLGTVSGGRHHQNIDTFPPALQVRAHPYRRRLLQSNGLDETTTARLACGQLDDPTAAPTTLSGLATTEVRPPATVAPKERFGHHSDLRDRPISRERARAAR